MALHSHLRVQQLLLHLIQCLHQWQHRRTSGSSRLSPRKPACGDEVCGLDSSNTAISSPKRRASMRFRSAKIDLRAPNLLEEPLGQPGAHLHLQMATNHLVVASAEFHTMSFYIDTRDEPINPPISQQYLEISYPFNKPQLLTYPRYIL